MVVDSLGRFIRFFVLVATRDNYVLFPGFNLVSDPSTVLKKFCGNSVPIQVVSTFNHLRFTFHSDNTTNGKGFLLEYSLYLPKEHDSSSSRDQSGE